MFGKSFAPTALLALAALAPVSLAQAPKAGDFYEDPTDIGFKVKMPEGWDFVPGSPAEPNLIGKYTAPADKGVLDTSDNRVWPFRGWILKFDRRPKAQKQIGEGEHKFTVTGAKDLDEWLGSGGVDISGWGKPAEKKDSVISKVNATEYVYKQSKNANFQVAVYACVYHVKPDVDVAVVFNGPGDDKKWSKFDGPFRSMAKSFKPIEAASVAVAGTNAAGSYREQKWRQLQDKIAASPGWHLDQSPNYFFVSAVDDKEFMTELKDRLEAIRTVYVKMYPPETGVKLRALRAKHAKEEGDADGEPKDKPEEAPATPAADGQTAAPKSQPVDITELATCSVVRVCANNDQYQAYGGPPSTAGYFNWVEEELVIFDDKASGGRGDTWLTMNHEAFHQYIHYLVGHIDPQSWFNEGTGDFFSGYKYEHKKFSLEPASWRQRTIQEHIRSGEFVPLKEIVHYTQAQYYDGRPSKYKTDVFVHYAEGWAIVYFLRTGEKNAKGWNPAWNTILDTYLQTLCEFGDVDKAVNTAFAGVNWEELEACWKEYILK